MTHRKKLSVSRVIPAVVALLAAIAALATPNARAGILDLPAFLPEGAFSLGIEPEIIISEPTGAGINLKPKYGAGNVLNWQGIIGTASGNRGMRLGVTADFDWFPDVDNQPGIATPVTFLYSRLKDGGKVSYGFSPLVYKTFKGTRADYTPFVSLPFGWNTCTSTNDPKCDSKTQPYMDFAMGSMFKSPGAKDFRFTIEAGFDIRNTSSYISGGVTWFTSGPPSSERPSAEVIEQNPPAH